MLLIGGTALLVMAVVAAITATTATRRPLPDRSGTLAIPGLSAEVQVLRDDRGIPHLYAQTSADLFLAQGYVHAQDRFFEMDARRHITAGRLAELVGDNPDAIAADRAVRTMGWRRVAEQEVSLLSAQTRQYLQAYADGVNAYLRDRSSGQVAVEYTILDLTLPEYQIEPWQLADSLAWLKGLGWELKGNYTDEVTRARASAFLPQRRIEELYPDVPSNLLPVIPDPASVAAASASTASVSVTTPEMAAAIIAADDVLTAIPQITGQGAGVGSNSWVVDGSRTETGKPLLANDPHLATQAPSAWYQMGLHCTTVNTDCPFDVSGFTFAGLPTVVIGHNANIAWGFTNLPADVTDMYLERVSGDNVQVDGSFRPLTKRTETLRIRGGEDISLTVRSTGHGPLISDVLADAENAGRDIRAEERDFTYDVALAWTALTPGRTADGLFDLNRASDWASFRDAMRTFESPTQHVIYADTVGNIGYQMPGRVPVRRGYDGRWPVPGWDSSYRWESFVPFDELPSVRNPDEGFIVAANQEATAQAEPYLTGDWMHGYRSQRIRDLLFGERQISTATMSAIQSDTKNPMAPTLVPALLQVDLTNSPFTQEAQNLLRDWDFTQPVDSAAAAYYNAVWRNLLRLTFDDELGVELAASGDERWFTVVADLLRKPTDQWWDDKATPGLREGRDEILRQALRAARVDLTQSLGKDVSQWEWGNLHQVQVTHQLLGGEGIPGVIQSVVNRGPYPVAGSTGAVNSTSGPVAPGYDVRVAPSMRMVVDLADLDQSTWVNLTGSSGHPGDSHYDDQIDAWLIGRSFPWPFTAQAVAASTKERLVLRPQ
ncbi:MAG: penicillin acylase family protein [Actinomycetota bacterium]